MRPKLSRPSWGFYAALTMVGLVALALVLVPVPTAMGGGAPSIAFNPSSWDFGTIAPGSTASKTFVLTNNGGSATGALQVTLSGSSAFSKTVDTCTAVSLGPRKQCSVTVQYRPTTLGSTDSGTLSVSSKKPPASASAALTGKSTPVSLKVHVAKSASPADVCGQANSNVFYSYTVSNDAASNVSAAFTVTDSVIAGAQAAFEAANGGSNILAPGAQVSFLLSSTITSSTTNTVSVSASSSGQTATDSASTTVNAFDCRIRVTKSPSPSSVCRQANASVTYSYTVANPGDIALKVSVSDDKIAGAQAAFVAANGGSDILAAGASVSFTLSAVITTTTANTVTASGAALNYTAVDSASATVNAVNC
jgi:Cep192 domain 4